MVTCKSLLTTLLASFLFYVPLYSQIDTSPKPYGGSQRMREFICNEMVYPEAALESKVEGTVAVFLTVLQDGKTTNYRIPEPVSPELDLEALRICKLIMFYPAVKSSNYIIDDFSIPVKFNIKKYNRNCKKKGFDNYEKYEGPIDTSLQVYPTKALDQSPVPAFEDAEMNFTKFISENMKYPELAYSQNIAGDVELSFIVETSGRISNLEVVDPLGGGCTEEAIHLLKQILWKPGMQNGMAVRTLLTAHISFSLSNNSNHQYLPNNNNTTM
ncbi:MAG: TonB family protein [Bacteroidales bacterium]|nr:TonB family protein [Bacteroidales bacterium]